MPLGPVEIEVIRNALTAAAAEMDVTVWRTSRSTIVRELLDYSTAVFDSEGNNLAQSARIPSHLNSMSHFLRELLDKWIDPAGWGPDDVVISNDPYCGGQHLPDICAFNRSRLSERFSFTRPGTSALWPSASTVSPMRSRVSSISFRI